MGQASSQMPGCQSQTARQADVPLSAVQGPTGQGLLLRMRVSKDIVITSLWGSRNTLQSTASTQGFKGVRSATCVPNTELDLIWSHPGETTCRPLNNNYNLGEKQTSIFSISLEHDSCVIQDIGWDYTRLYSSSYPSRGFNLSESPASSAPPPPLQVLGVPQPRSQNA